MSVRLAPLPQGDHRSVEAELRSRVPRYRQLRAALTTLLQRARESCDKNALMKSVHRLGIEVDGRTIVFGNETDLAVLNDYVLHDWRRPIPPGAGLSAVDLFLRAEGKRLTEDERLLTTSAAESVVSVYAVESPIPGTGAFMTDVFSKQRAFVHDVNLGTSLRSGDGLVLAARLVTDGVVNLTSGVSVPVLREAAVGLGKALETRFTPAEVAALHELNCHRRSELSTILYREALAVGGGDRMQFEVPGATGAEVQARRT